VVKTSRVIFLGTAGTAAVATKQLRSSGGIIFQIEDLQFHLDPGPGTIVKAKELGINLHHTTAILVSDSNIIHCNDVNILVDAMTHGGIEHRGLILASKSVIQDDVPFLMKHYRNFIEKIIPIERDHKVGIELVEINALSVEQSDPVAIGFKFFCPKYTLAYTGDTIVTDKLLEELSGTDILILNVPFPGNKGDDKHLNTENAIKIVSHVRPRLVVLTGFGLEMLKADPLSEAREVQRITGVQTIAARDGLSIAPAGYKEYKSPVRGFD
jgi:ribonuclease BN (tRNA processing enzyme)